MRNLSIVALGLLMFASVAKAGLYDLNTTSSSKNCQVLRALPQKGPGLKVVQCENTVPEEKIDRSFVVAKSPFRDLPEFVRAHFKEQQSFIGEWEDVYLSISTENDDLVLLGLCKARDTACDDVGYTVGTALSLGGVYNGKYDVELKVANGLYTKTLPNSFHYDSINDQRQENQYIRTVLLVEFLMSSARQKNLFYWSMGTGAIGLSSEEKFGIFDAAGNQRTIHRILNNLGRDMAVHRTNLNDGQADQWGFYLLAGLGAQKFLNSKDGDITSRSYAQVTTRMSTLSKHSELRLEVGTELGHRVGRTGRASVGGNIATTKHSAGVLNQATVYFKYETGKKMETSLGLTCQRGVLPNFASYNTPNATNGKPECLYKLSMKYYLD